MTITMTVTKAELDIIVRGVSVVLVDENTKSGARHATWKATRAYQVAEALEHRLQKLSKEVAHGSGKAN